MVFSMHLLLAAAIECWLPELRDPEYGMRWKRLRQRSVNGPVPPFTIIMFGSSRTTLGFRASDMERLLSEALNRPVVVFNFGITGGGPVTELLTLRRLLAHGVCPDLVLLEVMPPFLTGKFGHEFLRLPAHRLWLEDLPLVERYGGPGLELRNEWWQCWFEPWHAHRFALVSRAVPILLPFQLRMDWLNGMDDSGVVPGLKKRLSAEDLRRGTEGAIREYSEFFAASRLEPASCRAWIDLLELCREHGVKAALVLMPEGSAFRARYNPEVWRQIKDFLDALSRTYKAPVINAREWIEDDGFFDSHHLIIPGAITLARRLSREGVLPLLQDWTLGTSPGQMPSLGSGCRK